jgi:hypothetical protein
LALRRTFATCYRRFGEQHPPESLPLPLRPVVTNMGLFDYNLFMFSDSVIISVPLETRTPARAATGLLVTLHSIAATTLTMLLRGAPLRAGLDVGYGISNLLQGEVYGHVALSAYELESCVADYPRSVIGGGVHRALAEFEDSTMDGSNADDIAAVTEAVRCCRDMICTLPGDEHATLDFLAKADLYPEGTPERAAAWVRDRRNFYRDSGDERLEGRYARLAEYFQQRGY